MTRVVLEQDNTAAALLIQVEGGRWAPLEFLNSENKRTGNIHLVVEAGETVVFKCRSEPYIGKTLMSNGTPKGGQVRLHLYGNLEEVDVGEPEAKRPRQRDFQEGRADTLRP